MCKRSNIDIDLEGINFIYSGKATKFCHVFTLLLTVCTVVKSKVKILQNFMAFSEYMIFDKKNGQKLHWHLAER